jgi:hypothetical protein
MIIALQVVGALAVLVGLATIGIGIPVKEFSFGNTLIVAGTVGFCTGLILLGLSVVAAEFRMLARRLAGGARAPAEPRSRQALPAFPAAAPSGEAGPMFSRDQPPIAPHVDPAMPTPVGASPGHEGSDSGEPPALEPAPVAPPQKPRRNLMFETTMRKERERSRSDGGPADVRAQPPQVPPVPETAEAPPANFEDAWPRPDPRPDRVKGAEAPPPRRSSRPPPAPAESNAGAAAERTPPARTDEQPGVTVLKSGVVDGMAYSLYSDGSIEAQMPEGMMRFASIDALRAHLDQRP